MLYTSKSELILSFALKTYLLHSSVLQRQAESLFNISLVSTKSCVWKTKLASILMYTHQNINYVQFLYDNRRSRTLGHVHA